MVIYSLGLFFGLGIRDPASFRPLSLLHGFLPDG
jgi:hypothetical protein